MKIKSLIKKIIPKRVKNTIVDKSLEIAKNKLRNTECQYKLNIGDTKKLEGKIAIITGGSGAIGSAIAFRLAMEGALVYIAGRNKKNLKDIENFIKEHNGKATAVELDVTSYESIKSVFSNIHRENGKIDILVNNAGGSARVNNNTIEKQSVETIDEVLNVNLRGAILCSKEAIHYMKNSKNGRIVNIGSTVGVGGLASFSEYCASKAGVIGFTKSLAMEVAKYGITVNCVSPGITNQVIWDKALDHIPSNKNYIGRKGKTDDIANAVEFFCREESDFVIGQNLIVDGGRSLGLKGE